jgi:ABC-type phosphate/phosphonate transport system substrate-binding protein
MKKVLLSMAVAAFVVAGCNGKKADDHEHDHSDGTHQHEGGAIHENHPEEASKQEEFTVSKDTGTTSDSHGHEHGEGDDHQH